LSENGREYRCLGYQAKALPASFSHVREGIVAFDLGIKTLATGYTDQGRFYHIGGFRGYRWYNKQLDVRLVSPKPAA
jgi:transposase